jgi:hypothetical protein
MPNNNPKRQKGEEDGTLSGISSALGAEDDENTITTTTQRLTGHSMKRRKIPEELYKRQKESFHDTCRLSQPTKSNQWVP